MVTVVMYFLRWNTFRIYLQVGTIYYAWNNLKFTNSNGAEKSNSNPLLASHREQFNLNGCHPLFHYAAWPRTVHMWTMLTLRLLTYHAYVVVGTIYMTKNVISGSLITCMSALHMWVFACTSAIHVWIYTPSTHPIFYKYHITKNMT